MLLKVSLFERGSWCERLSLLVCSHCFSATQKMVDDVCFVLQKYAISGVALMPNLGVCGFGICYISVGYVLLGVGGEGLLWLYWVVFCEA